MVSTVFVLEGGHPRDISPAEATTLLLMRASSGNMPLG
jgi:hypothetical protein